MAVNVVITGAANGIGKALSEKYLKNGSTVWGIDIDAERLETFALEAKKLGHSFHSVKCDITNKQEFESCTKSIVQSANQIHIWINNAGISGLGDFSNKKMEDFEKVISINLCSLVQGTQLALSHMENIGKGTIVNVASVAGHIPCPYLTAYSASKFAVVGFTQSLREELKLKEVPIKLILVSPGFVDTQMIAKGTDLGFPEYLSFLLSDTKSVASEIYHGVRRGKEEIFPTFNGKVLAGVGRHFPNLTVKGSRLLLSKSLKDLVLFRRQPPR